MGALVLLAWLVEELGYTHMVHAGGGDSDGTVCDMASLQAPLCIAHRLWFMHLSCQPGAALLTVSMSTQTALRDSP